MPSLDDPISENAKILYIGNQGDGKTGSKAALVAMGYKLLMIDTDRGFKILRSLLTNSNYPYAAYMKKHGINPGELISYIPIDVPFDLVTQNISPGRGKPAVPWNVLAPTSSKAWNQVTMLLKEWKDGDKSWGGINDWDNDVVLDFDTMSTLAEIAKYWVQDLNNDLGSLQDEHGRATGGAQEMIMRLMSRLTMSSVRCNVIVTGHIKRVDMSSDIPQSPEARMRAGKSVDAQGFPAVIGQAVSPYIGKKFNDMFICRRSGNGRDAERRIWSVPTDNTSAKHSAWVEESYPLSTGLAEIFAALKYQEPPHEFIDAIRGKSSQTNPVSVQVKTPGFGAPSGFGKP